MRNNMTRHRIRRRLIVWASIHLLLLATLPHHSIVNALSWQDPSAALSGRPPDPPGWRGEKPPRRDSKDEEPPLRDNSLHPQGKPQESYTPIHYQFRAVENDKRPVLGSRDLPTDVPLTELDRVAMETRIKDNDDRPYASARTDIITKFMSTKRGRLLLTLSSGVVGMTLGSFLGKVCS